MYCKGVPVDKFFFDKNVFGELAHEFQFKMNTLTGQQVFYKALEFLNPNK